MASTPNGKPTINASGRDVAISAAKIRAQGLLPIILYGKDTDPTPLSVPFKDFEVLYRDAGETTIINMHIDGEAEPHPVLIKDIQLNPTTNQHIHADFYQIKIGEKLKAMIPLRFVGEPPAIKEFGGILITNRDEVEVECLPRDLPRDIEVDLSHLAQVDDSITVGAINVPAGVEVLDDADDSIVVVAPPTAEEAESEPVSEAEAVASVEATEEKSEADTASDADANSASAGA